MSSVPFARATLLSLAKYQLSVHPNASSQEVSNDYLEELEKHVSLYPNDTNFVIKPEPGAGFGNVTCLENCCNRTSVKLVARVDLPDGGLRRGFGSLASYRAHIANNHITHPSPWNYALTRPNTNSISGLPTYMGSSFPQRTDMATAGNLHMSPGFLNSEPQVPIVESKPQVLIVKSEFQVSNVKFEPMEPLTPRKRLSDVVKPEDESDWKRFKADTPKASLAYITNASPSSSSPSRIATNDSNAFDIRSKISNIQSDIISSRRTLETIQRKPRKTAGDKTREYRLLTSIERLEIDKSTLNHSLLASTAVFECRPSTSVASPVEPHLQSVLGLTPSQYRPVTILNHAVASGSNVPLDAPMTVEPMHSGPEEMPMDLTPMTYVARADEINQFLLTAGNAAFFDGQATVEESLASLGLKDLFTTLPGMKFALMSHQVLSLDWMLQQEKMPGMRGGCLADEMGLGKTVQMIALMAKNRSKNPKRKMNLIVAPLALLDQWQLEIEIKTDCGFSCYIYHGQGRLKNRSDLETYDVILTTYHTLAAEWPDPEAKKPGQRRKNPFIVDERDRIKPAKKKVGLLHQVDWYRIILDEAHLIRNRSAQTSRVVVELGDADTYRWCLTGTPIINQLSDAYSLLRFLRIRPWHDWQDFNSHIALREKKDPTLATTRLQSIFRTMLLRRKKDTVLGGRRLIELPPKNIELVRLEFSQEERAIYQMVETKSQATFNKFLRQGTVLKNYNHVFEMLLRLRQICSHPLLVTEHNAEGAESARGGINDPASEYDRAIRLLGPEFVSKVVAKLQDSLIENMKAEEKAVDAAVLDEECPVCFEVLTESVVTECVHVFCRECILNVLDTPAREDFNGDIRYKINQRPCPVCRSAVSQDKIFARKPFEMAALKPFERKEQNEAQLRDSEDDLADFPAPDNDNARQISRKRMGKRKANRILDSDEEDEYDDVIIGSSMDTKATDTVPVMSEDHVSTKMKHTMLLLNTWRRDNPDEKVIIISQWTRYLEIMSRYLESERYAHVKYILTFMDDSSLNFLHRYQGSMSRNERNRAVRAFMTKEDATVMLMSLKCGGVGLNLTRANRVISLDLSWSSAIEGQSFDRVHRLGQQRSVFVQRLVIADTIEDRILALQERKKALSESSLGEGSGKKLGRLSVKELANLFGLDHRGRVL